MSMIIYNGVSIPYCNTTQFSQTSSYDQYNIDVCHTKFAIQVQGYIHLDYLIHMIQDNIKGPNPDNIDIRNLGVPGIINAIRARLLVPRRKLSFIVNGIDIIPKTHIDGNRANPVVPNTVVDPETGASYFALLGTVDSANGPRPKSCNISRFTNDMFVISFSIEAAYYENRTGSNSINVVGSNVLTNKWTETVDIDELQMAVRTRSGKFSIRSDNVGVLANSVINTMAVVGVPSGYIREKSSYTLSEDGLSVSYIVSDKHVYKTPPYPALTATGTYSESVGRVGIVRHSEMNMTLSSSSRISQINLIRRAVQIAMVKLSARGFRPAIGGITATTPGVLEAMRISAGMWENTVSLFVRARMPTISTFEPLNTFVFTPFTDRDAPVNVVVLGHPVFTSIPPVPPVPLDATWPSRGYRVRGASNIGLTAAAYFDPSLREYRVNQETGLLENREPGSAPLVLPGRAGIEPENFLF